MSAGSAEQAQAQLSQRLALKYNLAQAKRVLLFLSDGMGLGTQYSTRLFEGQSLGLFGEEHETVLDTSMHVGLAKTYNLNAQTPDSAGTATAFMSGRKTIMGVIKGGLQQQCELRLQLCLRSFERQHSL